METFRLKWLLLVWQCSVIPVCGRDVYTAAVYEHNTVLNPTSWTPSTRQAALRHMGENLDIYQEQVLAAHKRGAKIIVFPEDGLYGFNFSRDSVFPYLEPMPDPTVTKWNPCLHPTAFDNTEVLHRLSCMAKNSSMYLIANMGERQPCNHSDHGCPSDGRYQFNTNVVFDAEGALIAKYHKQNLFFEVAFNTPKTVQHVIFNTSFAGSFGIFTCFDILFYEPTVSLIENYGVKQIIFTTAWFNLLPLLSAVEFQQAFATAFSINLFAANLHHPEYNMTGSGIYTPSDSLYYYNMENNKGKLLVAEVPVIAPSNVHSLEMSKPQITSPFIERNIGPLTSDDSGSIFHTMMMYDNYTFISVTGKKGNLQVCSNILCCHVAYERGNTTSSLYALGVFDGFHTRAAIFYLQVCALVKCAGSSYDTCGQSVTTATDIVDFTLWGNFSTHHVYPEILASEMKLYHADTRGWGDNNYYMTKKRMSAGLVTAAFYGRWYEKD
uniref:biotinidase n=1 Tax=Pristiophorus japonicus TaxID=55135 RepID=UPI00398F2224